MAVGQSAGGRLDELVVVSNRLPYDLQKPGARGQPKRNVGGLVNALEPVLVERGGMWVGWDGAAQPSATAVASALSEPRSQRLDSGIVLHGVPLSEREVARYYHGLSNRAIWPLFHDFPGKAVFNPEDWAAYEQVNRRFAEVAMAKARTGGHVWVHDFHLMRVPFALRRLGMRGRIDFFLHIPFPPAEIFRALPWRDEVMAGLLAADTVVFHIERYKNNFVESARAVAGATTAFADPLGPVTLEHEGGRTLVAAEPIGIDVEDFERIAARDDVQARARRIRASYGGRPIIFGADRLDYTKGIRERFLAIERLLQTRPEMARTFVYVQVVVPSRHQVDEYRQMKRELDREVGRINGAWGSEGWVPIHYRYRPLDRVELVAHYLAASVALVTPLRDGMNLVAPEFVASRIDGDGVLLLSEFAGIAERLPGALLVNPNDLAGVSDSIQRALSMPEGERIERMRRMQPPVLSNRASDWAARCLATADAALVPAGAGARPRVGAGRPAEETGPS